MSSPRYNLRKTPTEFNLALEKVMSIQVESPKDNRKAQSSNFKERHAEMFRQYAEKMKTDLKASSNVLLDGLKSINGRLFELDRPFRRYYQNDALKPLPEIATALKGDFEFYGSPKTNTPMKHTKQTLRPGIPKVNMAKKPSMPKIERLATPRDMTPLKTESTPRISDSKFEIPKLDLTPLRKFESLPTSYTFRTPHMEPEYIKMEELKMPTNLYVASMKRRGLIREMIKSKGQMTKEQIEKKLEQENEVDKGYRNGIQELRLKDLQYRKKDIMSKSPNYNAYYQILALPSNRRLKVLSKLNSSRGTDVSNTSRLLTEQS